MASTTTARPERLDSLTGLRFVAALLVFGHHVSALGVMSNESLNFLRPGTAGVSFFFILSGFILTWTARGSDSPRSFWRRRVARVYPAYAAAWIGVTTINVASGDGFSWWDALALTLVQAWVPTEAAYFAVSAVFWTLSVEAFFYAMFPNLIRAVRLLPVRALWFLLISAIAATVAVAILVHPIERGSFGNWFSSIFPPVRLIEFAAGMVLARLLQTSKLPRVSLRLACLIALSAFLVAAYLPVAYMSIVATIVPFLILILAAAQCDLAADRSFFRARAVVLLGDWSYAFYLTHLTVISVVVSITESFTTERETWDGALLISVIAVSLIMSVAVAAALHYVVEKPLERRLRGGNSVLNLS